MIKNLIGYSFATLLLSVGMTSCQSDDMPAISGNEVVEVEAVAFGTIGDELTRTNRYESNEGLKFAWASGDKVIVIGEDGENKGVLTVAEDGVGQATATLNGKITARENEKVFVYYLGAKEATKFIRGEQNFDLSNQSGDQNKLGDYDVMKGQATITFAENGKANFNFNLESLFGFAHFHLNMPAGVTLTDETVTVKGENIMNATTLDLANGELKDKKEGAISVKVMPVNEDNTRAHVYMAMIPSDNATTEFEITVGEKTYKASLNARNYGANKNFNGAKPGHGKDIYFTENGSWSLIYSADGATNVPEPETATDVYGPSYTFTVSSKVPVKDGYKFLGWADEEGGKKVYDGGEEITLTQPGISKTIYAVWDDAWKYDHYILEYGTNGVYGRQEQYYSQFSKKPWIFDSSAIESPVKQGCTFIGWADSDEATEADYAIGSEIDITKEVTHKIVYPVWKENGLEGNITAPGATGTDYGN